MIAPSRSQPTPTTCPAAIAPDPAQHVPAQVVGGGIGAIGDQVPLGDGGPGNPNCRRRGAARVARLQVGGDVRQRWPGTPAARARRPTAAMPTTNCGTPCGCCRTARGTRFRCGVAPWCAGVAPFASRRPGAVRPRQPVRAGSSASSTAPCAAVGEIVQSVPSARVNARSWARGYTGSFPTEDRYGLLRPLRWH